eukprot:TRINITY_DN4848_c0_g1_i11.p1 TRINITY_DN4848_c0_g1~~TRINITY_DN4848_c0_g1_i11.p1  ORF type:complete len:407 (+),score=80.21 TRINITY_DN4848_c0_g1_i11:94-1314(+)
MAAAAAAGVQGAEQADSIRPVFSLRPDIALQMVVEPEPGLAALCPLRDCSVDHHYLAVLPLRRGAGVLCAGCNDLGQLGVGDRAEWDGFQPTATPLLSAAAVHVGCSATAALLRDGSVHTWGRDRAIGRDGCGLRPAAVGGLPPVALLAAGTLHFMCITTADEAYSWAMRNMPWPWCPPRPTRIAALSGLRVRRLACGAEMGAAELSRGALRVWCSAEMQPVEADAGAMHFPLRDLVCSNGPAFAADASGAVWRVKIGRGGVVSCTAAPLPQRRTAARLPQRRRAVRLAALSNAAVALTADGEIWHINSRRFCHSVSAAHPQLPLGLVPYGGSNTMKIVLAPDHCGGRGRLGLFARIAARKGIPCDPVREIITPYMVLGAYITGHSADPFGWPQPGGAPAAAPAAP